MTKMKSLELKDRTLSLIAIVISVISPFITYYFLQNSLREQQLKATAIRTVSEYWTGYSENPTRYFVDYKIRLTNDGKIPVDKVVLSFQDYGGMFEAFRMEDINITPPLPVNIELSSQELLIQFQQPLAPEQEIFVGFSQKSDDPKLRVNVNPPDGWVITEASSSTIYWKSMGGSGGFN